MKAPVAVGDILAGKYQVERVLGAGGMGVVVAARHLHLDERVAIKFLLAEALKERGLVDRFLREARSAAKIRSEHIARVYDVGTLPEGEPYIVMEYLDGSDLDALVKQHGPFPVEIAAEYTLQACEALAEAHAAGIVHRDLKPANLFVTTRSDGSPVVKVIDFGISKVVTGPNGGMDATKTAELRGSPLFMSPEQMRKPRDVDARSDIWSIGVTLYHLLTASYPFYAESILELCGMVFHEEPAPLGAKRPAVPVGFEAVVLRCLRKSPAERFSDVAELAAALVEFAPPGAKISAERAYRTLHGAGLPSRTSLPSVSSVGHGLAPQPPGRATPLPQSLPSVSSVAAASSPSVAPQSAVASQPIAALPVQTGKAWGSTGPTGTKKSAVFVAASVAGVLTLALVLGGILFLSRRGAEPLEAPVSSEAAAIQQASPASTPSSGGLGEPLPPVVLPTAAVVEEPQPSATSVEPAKSAAAAPAPVPAASSDIETGTAKAKAKSAASAKPSQPSATPSRATGSPSPASTSGTSKPGLFNSRK